MSAETELKASNRWELTSQFTGKLLEFQVKKARNLKEKPSEQVEAENAESNRCMRGRSVSCNHTNENKDGVSTPQTGSIEYSKFTRSDTGEQAATGPPDSTWEPDPQDRVQPSSSQ